MSAGSRRYVVLHHTGISPAHFDFLFEIEADATALTSLRSSRWPLSVGDLLAEIAEHRLLYLNYEGPISGGRGEVTRVDHGEIHVAELAIDPPTLGLRLMSATGMTTIELTLTHDFNGDQQWDHWTVQTLVLGPGRGG